MLVRATLSASIVGLCVTLAPASPALGAEGDPDSSTPQVFAKAKRVKCKPTQVVLKVGKRKRCRPLGAVFPPPAEVDPRFAFLKTAMDFSPPAAKGGKRKGKRGGKRPASLKRSFGGAGKKAYTAILAVLPKALAEIDEAAPDRAPLLKSARTLASAAAGCPDAPSQTSGFSDGGVNVSTTFTGQGASITITFEVGGHEFRIEYETSEGCGDFEIPRCPTAAGRADAQRSKSDRVLIQVRKGGQLLSSQSSSARRETRTQGQTAADALLDYVNVQDTIRMNFVANGQAVNGVLNRRTRINMRSETYDPAQSSATFAGAEALQRIDRGGFAALANGVITRYRIAESGAETIVGPPGWAVYERTNEGSFCIRASFDPATATTTVKKHQLRTLKGQALLNGGGGLAADGRWNLYEVQNGVFSPPSPQGASVSIPYRATSGTDGDALIARYRVSSTAGVTRSSWNADIEDVPTINQIAGSFGGDRTFDGFLGESVASFSGNLTFQRFTPAIFGGADGTYILSGGSYSLTVSGIESSGSTGCHQTGTGNFTIPANQGSMTVNGTPPDQIAPYDYTFLVLPPVELMTATRIDCPDGAEEWEGTTFQTGLLDAIGNQASQTSADGVSYTGSETSDFGGSSFTQNWSLTGTQD